jgi:hypothetical protein
MFSSRQFSMGEDLASGSYHTESIGCKWGTDAACAMKVFEQPTKMWIATAANMGFNIARRSIRTLCGL